MEMLLKAEEEVMNPADPQARAKQELAANIWLEEQLKEKLDDMSEVAYRAKIEKAEKAVAGETTPGVAKMLGNMRREMHNFAAPFYRQALEHQMAEVHTKGLAMRKEIKAGEGTEAPEEKALPAPSPEPADASLRRQGEARKGGETAARNRGETRMWLAVWAAAVLLLSLVAFALTLWRIRKGHSADLVVTIVGAKGLSKLNHFVGDSPYVVCEVKCADKKANAIKVTTKVLKKTLTPEWNEEHALPGWLPGEALVFTVYDKGMITSRVEGKAMIGSDKFYPSGFEGELPLETGSAATGATLQVRIVTPKGASGVAQKATSARSNP